MKKLLALLLAMMLVIPAAMAQLPGTRRITIPYEGSPTGSLTLEWYDPPSDAISTSEVFINGLYFEGRWEEAYELNLLLAEAGDTLSMLRLGHHCLNGLGTPQDEAAAMQWYERAQAGYYVALMYLNGWGVEADAQKAIAYRVPGADKPAFSNYNLACLYLLGCGNLAPDMDQAMYWLDQYAADAIHRKPGPGSVSESEYQERYEQILASFLAQTALPEELFARPSIIAWADGQLHASDAMDMGSFWLNGDGGVVDHAEAARWFEMAIEMDSNSSFVSEWSHAALGDFYRDGSLGVVDTDKALRHYAYAENYAALSQCFRDGVTGMDGTAYRLYLPSDAALAEAFDALDQHREHTDAHGIIGDLFRTGQTPEGVAVVTPDAYLAAQFYYGGFNDPYCMAQLTEMYKAGLITDPMLLYNIANNIVWSKCDVSELILLLADDLIHGRVSPWLPNNEINIRYYGVSTPATLGADLLKKALKNSKLPDPAAAYDLLALVPEAE